MTLTMAMTRMWLMGLPGNELIVWNTIDHDVFAAEIQSGQLSVQTEIMILIRDTNIPSLQLVVSPFSPILLLSSKPWLPVDESHALGNVNCKLNSCCCVHNKSANVTMNILKVKFVWGVWFRRHSWNTIGNDHDGGFYDFQPTLCLDVRLCEGCPQACIERSPPMRRK